jgi:hypothetical protein
MLCYGGTVFKFQEYLILSAGAPLRSRAACKNSEL